MATHNPFIQSSEVQALSHVIGSFLALSQIVHMLLKQAKARSALWGFTLVSLLPYLANVLAIRIAQSSAPLTFGHSQEHPIEALIFNAKADFKSLLQRQSTNYTAAYEEYRRRYGVKPPPGFGAWYQFATSHHSPIIDDFDMIFDKILPFWRLGGSEISGVMSDVYNTPNSDLWRCAFSGDHAKTHCAHPYRTFDRHIQLLFDELLGDLRGKIPDLNFLVNHLDEPRVLIPPLSWQGGDPYGKGKFKVTDMSRRPSWDALTRFCESQQSDRSDRLNHTVETFAIPFVTNPVSAMDLCRNPEYSTMHGFVMSPTSFYPIEGLVPLLSTGSSSTMGDFVVS